MEPRMGGRVRGLKVENMPSHAAIREFSSSLAAKTGYRVASEREDSRVCLLTRDGELHHIERGQLGEKFVANA